MNFNWQEMLPLLLVALAAIYLGIRFWRSLRENKQGGCGDSCGGCSSADANVKRPFVPIEKLAETPINPPDNAQT